MNTMNTWSFIILNYNVKEETIACIDSIKKLIVPMENRIKIVVVDNGSENNSGAELVEMYEGNHDITVILNGSNLGFARGNNVGIEYARNVIHSNFIIVLNSDTRVLQEDFLILVKESYATTNFSVLGPKIITPSGEFNYYVQKEPMTENELKKWIFSQRLCLYENYARIDNLILRLKVKFKNMIKILISPLYNKQDVSLRETGDQPLSNIKIHGCFLVFSPNFFDFYDGFYPDTFLYMEENILFYMLRKKGLISIYDPNIKIFHYEDASTNPMFTSNYLKRRFVYTNIIESSQSFLKYMKELNNEK